jgi:putative lipoic acid-binding regulatory protein
VNKPEIQYPCDWDYTVIGADEALMRAAAAECLCGKEHSVEFSKKSKAGKYVSLAVKTKVNDQAERDKLFIALGKHPSIKIVL